MNKTFVELIIEGPDDFTRGFVTGFVAARGPKAEVVFDDEAGLADDGLLQKVKEALHLSREVTHCIVDEQTAVLVREAIGAAEEARLSIHSDRVITGGSFAYEFEVFNRDNGAKFLRRVSDLPQGVTLEEHEQEIKEVPEAHGPELFAPEHEYTLVGKGRAVGPIDKIIWLYKEFDSISQVHVESIHVRYA